MLGREVRQGGGFADLLTVESTGRLAIIEVKLARNAESRRAVVAPGAVLRRIPAGLDLKQQESWIFGASVLAAAASPLT